MRLAILVLALLAGCGPTSAPAARPPAATATPRPTATAQASPAVSPTLVTVGDTLQAGNWEIHLARIESAKRIRALSAQGVFAIVTIGARNLHKEISQLNDHDFYVTIPDGSKFTTADPAMFQLNETPGPVVLLLGVKVQPSLVKEFRVVFDLNPAKSGYVLHAAAIPFRFTLPSP